LNLFRTVVVLHFEGIEPRRPHPQASCGNAPRRGCTLLLSDQPFHSFCFFLLLSVISNCNRLGLELSSELHLGRTCMTEILYKITCNKFEAFWVQLLHFATTFGTTSNGDLGSLSRKLYPMSYTLQLPDVVYGPLMHYRSI